MINFLNTFTDLVLNIFGFLKTESMICVTCFCLVLYVFGSFKQCLHF